ncbi:C40 family peptidase [Rathayibacter sp. YIM 133350]|uniref:C40 family peptidase n=1 Tax=Rathayibacter sp. YIM 133350 TaxID=3131992 RepID=UPI00307E51D6
MAERRRRPKPVVLLSAVAAAGAVTASIGIVAPALADPGYPSWDDIQNAKKNEASKKTEIDNVTALITNLQAVADEASRQSMIAAEKVRQAQDALTAATEREASIRTQADAAAEKAKTSKMRAGLLAAHLARQGGKEFSVDLFLNGDEASDLLHRLGAVSKLSEQSQQIYRDALQDRNTASSLAEQADAAAKEREKLAAAAKQASEAADAAANAAQTAVANQQAKSDELFAQLASLKDTTADLERERAQGIAAEEAARAAAAAAAAKAAAEAAAAKAAADAAAAAAANQNHGGGGSGGSGASSGGSASAPPPPPPPASNGNVVETAISFASAQLGKPYSSPGDSRNTWDCSGLTKSSYAYAGVYIGTHSATDQYNTMRSRGRLVPYSQRQRGDLIFWGSGGDYYHVAIYLGNNRILEAPDYGKNVREYYIWGAGDVAGYVGRPG